ncbi:hypothetical protein, partial [Salmonella enterica]|uniref:hypothetical protein n=1 Tax=Salmonella enterica TaxID=28901 RepID=UPI003523F783
LGYSSPKTEISFSENLQSPSLDIKNNDESTSTAMADRIPDDQYEFNQQQQQQEQSQPQSPPPPPPNESVSRESPHQPMDSSVGEISPSRIPYASGTPIESEAALEAAHRASALVSQFTT